MIISPARNDELSDALALLFDAVPTAADGQIAHVLQLIERGDLSPDDVLVARIAGRVQGAVLSQRLAGSIAVIWPARAANRDTDVVDALTNAALAHVSGVKTVQAFLNPIEIERGNSLIRAGFRHVTRVHEMRLDAAVFRKSPLRLQLRPYASVDAGVFRDILLRSHEESLDCPELNLLRTADEVLAGYLECASELSTWWLAYLVDEPVGVLLMLRNELTFVGVVPERRQQGIGRALLESAVELTRPLTLIVDARNAPALQLYSSVGFAIVGAREVFLRTNF